MAPRLWRLLFTGVMAQKRRKAPAPVQPVLQQASSETAPPHRSQAALGKSGSPRPCPPRARALQLAPSSTGSSSDSPDRLQRSDGITAHLQVPCPELSGQSSTYVAGRRCQVPPKEPEGRPGRGLPVQVQGPKGKSHTPPERFCSEPGREWCSAHATPHPRLWGCGTPQLRSKGGWIRCPPALSPAYAPAQPAPLRSTHGPPSSLRKMGVCRLQPPHAEELLRCAGGAGASP